MINMNKTHTVKTNVPALRRICKMLNSGDFILPFEAKPGQGHVDITYCDYGAGQVWSTIIFNNWQCLTPRDNALLNELDPNVSYTDLHKITNELNHNLLNLNNMSYKESIRHYNKLIYLIKNANINLKKKNSIKKGN